MALEALEDDGLVIYGLFLIDLQEILVDLAVVYCPQGKPLPRLALPLSGSESTYSMHFSLGSFYSLRSMRELSRRLSFLPYSILYNIIWK